MNYALVILWLEWSPSLLSSLTSSVVEFPTVMFHLPHIFLVFILSSSFSWINTNENVRDALLAWSGSVYFVNSLFSTLMFLFVNAMSSKLWCGLHKEICICTMNCHNTWSYVHCPQLNSPLTIIHRFSLLSFIFNSTACLQFSLFTAVHFFCCNANQGTIINLVAGYINCSDSFCHQCDLFAFAAVGVGKSCLLLRFSDDSFTTSFITTIGYALKIWNPFP